MGTRLIRSRSSPVIERVPIAKVFLSMAGLDVVVFRVNSGGLAIGGVARLPLPGLLAAGVAALGAAREGVLQVDRLDPLEPAPLVNRQAAQLLRALVDDV